MWDNTYDDFVRMTQDAAAMDVYLSKLPQEYDREQVRRCVHQRFFQKPFTVHMEMKLVSSYSVYGVEVIKESIKKALQV